jgi:O-antigen/teichoic acid export membrane protein
MIQRIIPRLNKLSVPKNEVFRAIKNDILSAVLFACTCCVIIWLTSPLIVSIIFSSDYEGLEDAIIFFSLALIPGLLSTIFISQVVIYIDVIKKAYISLGVACLLVFSILFYNIENLSVRIVLESLILGEWFLLLLIIYVIHKEIYSQNYD